MTHQPEERCAVVFMVTVPPGITKPMSVCGRGSHAEIHLSPVDCGCNDPEQHHAFVPAEPAKPQTCEVMVEDMTTEEYAEEPCGNPLPCKDHPKKESALCTCKEPFHVPSSDGCIYAATPAEDERAALLDEFITFPEPRVLIVRALIFLLKERA